jgi:hypothetical protein
MMPARKLWARKLRTGEEVRAALFYDSTLGGEATIEISLEASAGEDVLAEKLADEFRNFLDKQGAIEMAMSET